jgi:hypothetical protein
MAHETVLVIEDEPAIRDLLRLHRGLAGFTINSNLFDGIFADSLSSELVTPVGDRSSGYTASCQVGIAA